ncbi:MULTISPECIES: helix-turn-helix domain-containing protein [Eubacteriales]|uniref:helix-turn-helix domain-containing protein n=1 Tax=Eubacteriales TaxID=186802 RepID=UPI000B374AB8|nr:MULTISPECIES: helix-turn-helix domain-containing protein [Eubacteriales]OUN84960.1 AraC family transcriptional regulator [Gemmiger sp. An50]
MGYQALELEKVLRIDRIYSVHYFEYGPDYAFIGESHDFWEFVYADKGEVYVTAGEEEKLLKKGQMIFHEPGEYHNIRATGKDAPNIVIVSFDCASPAMDFFKGRVLMASDSDRVLMARIVEMAGAAFSTPLDDPLAQHLTRREDAAFGAEQVIGLSLETMLLDMVRRGDNPVVAKPTSLIRERSQNEFLSRVQQYLENNIQRRLTLSDICRDNLVGRSYLQKVFREKTGGGAMEYFGNLKIQKAKEMIREGSHNFTEIAALLGYNSIHYFSRHFKKVTGMTPSEYASSVKVLARRGRGEE